jgi:hypothetical protein
MASMKEVSIREYLSKIDFKKDQWSYTYITEDMRKFLGESPGIDIERQKDVMVNEVTGKSKEFEKIISVSVVFTDLDDKIKKVKILI